MRLWSVASADLLATLQGHIGSVQTVAFSGDGGELLTASQNGTLIRWNTTSHKMIGGPVAVHDALTLSAVYSPDGQLIVSGSLDKSVRV